MSIGILALQGDFEAHAAKVRSLGATCRLVRRASECDSLGGLIIPGGESTTLLNLLTEELRSKICELAASKVPILATCAGLIILAKEVTNPLQGSLKLLDVTVERNGYGRQVNSFIAPTLSYSPEVLAEGGELDKKSLEGVFIRAPRITRLGEKVRVLASYQNEPVAVEEGNIIAATFHPELSTGNSLLHRLLLGHGGN